MAVLAGLCTLRAGPQLTEFMAANTATLADDDGAYSDWIEIYNPGPGTVDLSGWYLTDTATNKMKWQFPAVSLAANQFVVVWASNKNRRDPTKPLHTNFALSSGGEYLGLIGPDGATVASEFAPTYPPQRDDTSYGVSQAAGREGDVGFFSQPTPGRPNGPAARNLLYETANFSRPSGVFKEPFTLQLSGAASGQKIRWVRAAPSERGFATPDPTAGSEIYSGPVVITTSVYIRAAVFSDNDTLQGPVTIAHYVRLDPTAAGFASTLPVLVLDNHGFGPLVVKDGIDHPTWLYAYRPRGPSFATFANSPDHATPLTSTIRGQSASEFPKKSFNLKFTSEAGAKRNQSLFGSAAYEKWALISPWYFDRTLISNPLAYALSNRIGRWAPRTQATEVFFNTGTTLAANDYQGISVLVDRIEIGAGRVEITPLTGADTGPATVTGGYILKLDPRDEDEYGFVTDHGVPEDVDSMVVVAYPKDADLAAAQRTYIRTFIQAMEDTLLADAAAGWSARTHLDYIDRSSWVDHHILNTLAANPDAFRRSAYFTKNRNGRLQAGPLWDFDRAFNSTDPRNVAPEGWRGSEDGAWSLWNIGWWRTLVRDPEFMQEWIDRWQSLRRTEFSDANLTALVGALAGTVGRDAAARDAVRWPDNASRFGDYDGEIEALKTWLVRRAAWIDRQFIAAPGVVTQGANLVVTPPAGAQLAYTLDGSDPRSVGGALAPNAIVSAGPIEVPATANLHARSHDAAWSGGFPGSPWSSAVVGAASTPLTPAPRVVNVSAQAVIGSGQEALVARLVVANSDVKGLLARAVGPGLGAFGVTGFIPDPQLTLQTGSGIALATNRTWESGADAARLPLLFRTVGAFPLAPGSGDAALTATVKRGAYDLVITSPTGRSGLGLAELYELDANGSGLNLSFSTFVRSDSAILLAGFVIQGPASQRILIRARGPTLAGTGTAPNLRELELRLNRGPNPIATNTGWSRATNAAQIANAFRALGITPATSTGEDAAIFVTLPPGPYTVSVRGTNGAEGVALLAIQEVP